MLERDLQDTVLALADVHGWMAYHTHDSRRSQPGYPDLHLVHVGQRRSIFRELKKQTGRVTPAQQEWLDALTAVGVDAAVWRPADLLAGTILNDLKGQP
ncbi:VRR-NUC domain-containing protein [Rarobacter faecitabidus]|nr:VRR-NUC domain-containing protein [Rarobacter faecitabidus]